jgi:predicted MPP superfamily phosphohydrolase
MSKHTISEKHVRDHLLEKAGELRGSNRGSIDKRVAVATARDLIVVEELQKSLSKVFSKGWCVPPKYTGKRLHSPSKRIVNVLLSDLHFGSHLDKDECPFEYNTVQESRRLGKVVSQVAEYKTQYRNDSKLVIHLLGDIIQNQLHDPRDGEPLSIQFATAVHYLVQAVLYLASAYSSVEIYCVTGNHGRNTARHQQKATNQKFDSIETMIYVALKTAIQNSDVTNVKINIPKTPYYTVQLFDAKMFATHGDSVLRPGNPGKSINVANLYQQVCKFNTARNIGGPFDIFSVGHIHVGSITNLPGNVTMITNGALTPPDNYSVSVGYPDNTCGQYLWESVVGHAVGDQRFIVVDGAEDKSKYNDIIKPFEGL